MRYRMLDQNGDYTFGRGLANFYIDVPAAVGQAVGTRLRLQLGEWFQDTTDGTPWQTQVLGKYTQGTRDLVVKSRVVGTPGVVDYRNYWSTLIDRQFTIGMKIDTIYGVVTLSGPL